MGHPVIKHYVSILSIVALVAFGIGYLMFAKRLEPTVIITIVAGIAGLGGYQIRKRNGG